MHADRYLGGQIASGVNRHVRSRGAQANAIGKLLAVALFYLISLPSSAAAQSIDQDSLSARPVPFDLIGLLPASNVFVVSQEQIQQVDEWQRAFAKWQESAERWLNRRRKRTTWSDFLERHKKPEPPAWLESACQLLADDRQFSRPCQLLAASREDVGAAKTRLAKTEAITQKEAPTKTLWWQHLHVDGLWSTTQSSVLAFGVFGAHMTVEAAGRLQIFVAPGILLVSVPSFYGTRELLPATDWGATYRLFDVGRSTVHFNLVHAWMLGSNGPSALMPSMTLAGFSVSFRPRPH